MIKSIQLKNWQAHENLKLDFSDNINVITGLSDSGKSCVRRALGWVIFNANISEVDYRREGTTETSVSLTLKNGIIVERIRSNTLNRYVLKKEGYEDKVFDSIGKEIPEEIKNVLNLFLIEIDKDSLNLNIANQLTLPFLLDKPASFRAKLFNKLTGNEILDTLFVNLNRENLNCSKEIKRLDNQIVQQEKDTQECMKLYTSMYENLQKVKKIYSKIEEEIIIYDELKKLASKIKNNKNTYNDIKSKLEKIVIISDNKINSLKERAELLKELTSIQNKLKETKLNLDVVINEQKIIEIPKVNLEELKQKAQKIDTLKKFKKEINQNNIDKEKVNIKIKEKQTLYNNLSKQLKEIWNKLDFCSKCKPKVEKIFYYE